MALPGRFHALDLLRLLAACLIALMHFEAHIWRWPGAPRHFAGLVMAADFFFVLSGFVMCHHLGGTLPARGVPDFLRRRLARIWPLHVLTMLLWVAGMLLVQWGRPERSQWARIDGGEIVAHLFLVQAWGVTGRVGLNQVSWSVSAEWFCYLLFPLLLPVMRRGSAWVALLLALAFLLLLEVGLPAAGLVPWPVRTHDWGAIHALPGFCLGMAAWRVWQEWRPAIGWSMAVAAALLLLALLLVAAPAWLTLLVSLLVVLGFAAAESRQPLSPSRARAFGWWGDLSYGVYLWHPLVILLTLVAASGSTMRDPVLGLWGTVAVGAVLTLLVAWAGFHWFERPARNWMSGLRVSSGRTA